MTACDCKPSLELGRSVLIEGQRSVAAPTGKWIILITVLVGLLAAVAVTTLTPSPDRSFAAIAVPVQSLMSVTAPFLGVFLVSDVYHVSRGSRLGPKLLAAIALAVAFAFYGVLICVLATAVAPSDAVPGPWQHVGVIVLGSVLVQVLAQLIGTGLGLLMRPAVLAMVASVVLPLGLWLLLGGVDATRPAQAWLTPYASVQKLLSGQMSPLNWVQWLVVAVLWGVGLNALGARRIWRRREKDEAERHAE